MPQYVIYSQSDEGGNQASWTMDCGNDDESRDIANGVLASGPMKIIEVWRNREMVCRLVKPSGPAHLAPAQPETSGLK